MIGISIVATAAAILLMGLLAMWIIQKRRSRKGQTHKSPASKTVRTLAGQLLMTIVKNTVVPGYKRMCATVDSDRVTKPPVILIDKFFEIGLAAHDAHRVVMSIGCSTCCWLLTCTLPQDLIYGHGYWFQERT